jgi:drug/metabolite transporter (DMT)-like permease
VAEEPREYADLAFVAISFTRSILGGVFVSLDGGMAAGHERDAGRLQPLLTVVLAPLLDEGEREPQGSGWGLVLGLAGVYFVVRHKIDFSGDLRGLVPSAVALVGISVGTLYQKRHCAHVDLRSGSAVQFTVCALLYIPLALFVDARPVQWTGSFAFALGWSVLVLSVGAISLLYWLLRHGAAANVARLFYLVPPVTALEAYLLFGEKLDTWALVGMVLICLGVMMARRNVK